MDSDFAAIEARATALRITVPELIEQLPDISYMRFWRAKKGKVSVRARVVVLRQIEQQLTKLEQERTA